MCTLYKHATAVEAMRGLFTRLENRAGNLSFFVAVC